MTGRLLEPSGGGWGKPLAGSLQGKSAAGVSDSIFVFFFLALAARFCGVAGPPTRPRRLVLVGDVHDVVAVAPDGPAISQWVWPFELIKELFEKFCQRFAANAANLAKQHLAREKPAND